MYLVHTALAMTQQSRHYQWDYIHNNNTYFVCHTAQNSGRTIIHSGENARRRISLRRNIICLENVAFRWIFLLWKKTFSLSKIRLNVLIALSLILHGEPIKILILHQSCYAQYTHMAMPSICTWVIEQIHIWDIVFKSFGLPTYLKAKLHNIMCFWTTRFKTHIAS